MINPEDIESRLPIWVALSELFLDTELSESDHEHIAKVINESAYSAEDIERILWQEVFPAVGFNLQQIAGEWAGFDEESLKQHILEVTSESPVSLSRGIISWKSVAEIISEEWSKVKKYLPAEYQQSELTVSLIEELMQFQDGKIKAFMRKKLSSLFG